MLYVALTGSGYAFAVPCPPIIHYAAEKKSGCSLAGKRLGATTWPLHMQGSKHDE
ncbi:hypothetical protein [Collimonas sp. OK242]|jgi:hypothetical protein|uniref:hypothetical protein n=1 Tax=Collimonas sp. OK242 TaxID=1798195 RepID=UPI0015A25FA5|nr:hypothetical protein [Collimonas sp. OK242]